MKLLLATTLTLLVALTPVKGASNKEDAKSFASFWAKFETAVANKNKEAIAAMTKFPFTCFSDRLTKADFIKQWDKIFSAKRQRCLRAARPVKDAARDSYSIFCGETIFVFEKGSGEYQFTDMAEND
ncbi:MAG: hypothetical protein QOC70_1339 [Verrucomicrobiota bacterium]|jgi:hypothetical protein